MSPDSVYFKNTVMTLLCNVVSLETEVSTAMLLHFSICIVLEISKALLMAEENWVLSFILSGHINLAVSLRWWIVKFYFEQQLFKTLCFWISHESQIMSLVHLCWLFASCVEKRQIIIPFMVLTGFVFYYGYPSSASHLRTKLWVVQIFDAFKI